MVNLFDLHNCSNNFSAGMTIFDAVNHAMSTISTGGFSTKSESIAFWNDKPLIQYIIIIFMFLAGTNFVLSYFAFTKKFQKIFQDEEFKLYSRFIIFFSLLVIIFILLSKQYLNTALVPTEFE